ncbi:MAG: hypothetical protein IPN95_26735 [Bacteroidetes bacterium]|jgi:hypothetical protein|nr:hypothetical protein [Bacteroidota bacterium]
MRPSVLLKDILPFALWYGLMILFALGIDLVLHSFGLVWVGRYLGYVGTFVVIFSFLYSLRKRKVIKTGSLKTYMSLHEYMAWSGSILILVHAGIHFNAILPWLATLLLLVNVASGLVAKFLLVRANETLKSDREQLLASGISAEEVAHRLHFETIAVSAMKKWRVIHLPIALMMAIFSLIHIVTVFMFSK